MTTHFDGPAIIDDCGTGGHFAHCGKKLNGTGDKTTHWDDKTVNCEACLEKVRRSNLADEFGAYYQKLHGNRKGLGVVWQLMDKVSTKDIIEAISNIKASIALS